MSLRAYGAFDHGYGFEAGANILDMAKIGLDQGLLVLNVSLVSDAYQRVHNTLVIQEDIGIKVDGVGDLSLSGSVFEHLSLIDQVGWLLRPAPRVALQR
jgi:hypothetical protein